MTTQTPNAPPSAPPSASPPAFRAPAPPTPFDARSLLRWGVGILIIGTLFLWLPYQRWTFADKISILAGWARVLARDPSGEWIFCPLVPAFSLWMVWRARSRLEALPIRGHSSGIVLLLLGALLFWIGYRASTAYPGFAAMQFFLAGLVAWLCGWGWLRTLAFPLAFLVFMWPGFPLESQVAVPMRVFAASLTAKLLNSAGIAAVSEGTALASAADAVNNLPQGALFKLDVAAACSGLRSLYALLILACVTGYLGLRRWSSRAVLFLSALPLAVAGNVVRLLLLAVTTLWLGEDFAVGRLSADGEETSWFHQFAGLSVYGVALLGIFGLSTLLERSRWDRRPHTEPRAGGDPREDSLRVTAVRSTVALGLASSLLFLCVFDSRQPSAAQAGVSLDLPPRIGTVPGRELPITARERRSLPEDITIQRMMYSADGFPQTQIALVLDGAAAGRGLHQPEVCAVAQAWRMLDETQLSLDFEGRPFKARMLRLFSDEQGPLTGEVRRRRAVHVFWYQGAHGVKASTHHQHLFRSYWDSVFGRLVHRWALVSFSTYLPAAPIESTDRATEEAAIGHLKAVIAEVAPQILRP